MTSPTIGDTYELTRINGDELTLVPFVGDPLVVTRKANPMTTPTPDPDALCVCGHTFDRHKEYLRRFACFAGCTCRVFRLADNPTPPSLAQQVADLTQERDMHAERVKLLEQQLAQTKRELENVSFASAARKNAYEDSRTVETLTMEVVK